MMLHSERGAHWDSTGRRFWALSSEHHKTVWQAIIGRSFRNTLEPSFYLRSVRDQTGGEGPATPPPPAWDVPLTFQGLEAPECYGLTMNLSKPVQNIRDQFSALHIQLHATIIFPALQHRNSESPTLSSDKGISSVYQSFKVLFFILAIFIPYLFPGSLQTPAPRSSPLQRPPYRSHPSFLCPPSALPEAPSRNTRLLISYNPLCSKACSGSPWPLDWKSSLQTGIHGPKPPIRGSRPLNLRLPGPHMHLLL